jgi:hypothetical protein
MKIEKTEKKYRITLSERQLYRVIECVEDIHRFIGGQVEMYNATCMLDNMHELHNKMRKEIYPLVVPELYRQHGFNASYGWDGSTCPNKHQKKFLAETYYLYRELLHQLTLMRNSGEYNVYNSPTLTCEDSGEPIMLEEL